MDRFPPSIPPRVATLLSTLIGFALIDNFSANEQNAIGNWLMTIGQILEANSAWQQVVEERIRGYTLNINSKKSKQGGGPYMDNPTLEKGPDDFELDDIEKMIKIIQEEIEKIKKELV